MKSINLLSTLFAISAFAAVVRQQIPNPFVNSQIANGKGKGALMIGIDGRSGTTYHEADEEQVAPAAKLISIIPRTWMNRAQIQASFLT